jgi:hypothetical protein
MEGNWWSVADARQSVILQLKGLAGGSNKHSPQKIASYAMLHSDMDPGLSAMTGCCEHGNGSASEMHSALSS